MCVDRKKTTELCCFSLNTFGYKRNNKTVECFFNTFAQKDNNRTVLFFFKPHWIETQQDFVFFFFKQPLDRNTTTRLFWVGLFFFQHLWIETQHKTVLFSSDAEEQPGRKRRRRIKNDLFDSSSDEGKHSNHIEVCCAYELHFI